MYKYWKLGKCSKKRKLQVWNAVIRSKLTYGLVTLQINKDKASRLDAFQLKGIRRILKWKTTYIERKNTNRRLRRAASEIINQDKPKNKLTPQFEELSKRLQDERIKCLGHLLRESKDEPTRQAALNSDNTPNIGWLKRAGRPRNNWIELTMKEAWQRNRKNLPYGKRKHKNKARKFNIRAKRVIRGLLIGAQERIF